MYGFISLAIGGFINGMVQGMIADGCAQLCEIHFGGKRQKKDDCVGINGDRLALFAALPTGVAGAVDGALKGLFYAKADSNFWMEWALAQESYSQSMLAALVADGVVVFGVLPLSFWAHDAPLSNLPPAALGFIVCRIPSQLLMAWRYNWSFDLFGGLFAFTVVSLMMYRGTIEADPIRSGASSPVGSPMTTSPVFQKGDTPASPPTSPQTFADEKKTPEKLNTTPGS